MSFYDEVVSDLSNVFNRNLKYDLSIKYHRLRHFFDLHRPSLRKFPSASAGSIFNTYTLKNLEMFIQLFKEKKSNDFAVFGEHHLAKKFAKQLNCPRYSSLDEMMRLMRGTQTFPKDLIVAEKGWKLRYQLRKIQHVLNYQGKIWVPGDAGISPKLRVENPEPFVMFCPPCAGTNRLGPALLYLFSIFGWEFIDSTVFIRNSFFNKKLNFDKHSPLDQFREVTESVYWRAKSLDYYQVLYVHQWVDLKRILEFGGRVVVLLRDPRDILNSFSHRVLSPHWKNSLNSDPNYESALIRCMRGSWYKLYSELEYTLDWPPIEEITNSYRSAIGHPKAINIRFEDLRVDEISVILGLFSKLQIYPNPFIEINEDDINVIRKLISYEYQSKESLGNENSRKRGIAGEWAKNFSSVASKEFHERTNDSLSWLGYE